VRRDLEARAAGRRGTGQRCSLTARSRAGRASRARWCCTLPACRLCARCPPLERAAPAEHCGGASRLHAAWRPLRRAAFGASVSPRQLQAARWQTDPAVSRASLFCSLCTCPGARRGCLGSGGAAAEHGRSAGVPVHGPAGPPARWARVFPAEPGHGGRAARPAARAGGHGAGRVRAARLGRAARGRLGGRAAPARGRRPRAARAAGAAPAAGAARPPNPARDPGRLQSSSEYTRCAACAAEAALNRYGHVRQALPTARGRVPPLRLGAPPRRRAFTRCACSPRPSDRASRPAPPPTSWACAARRAGPSSGRRLVGEGSQGRTTKRQEMQRVPRARAALSATERGRGRQASQARATPGVTVRQRLLLRARGAPRRRRA